MVVNASSQMQAGYDLMIIVVCGLFSAYTLVVICRLLMEGVPDKLNYFKTPTGTATPCIELLDMRSRQSFQSREALFSYQDMQHWSFTVAVGRWPL